MVKASIQCMWKKNKQERMARNVHRLHIRWVHSLVQGNQAQGQFCFLLSQEEGAAAERRTLLNWWRGVYVELLCIRGYWNCWRSVGMFLDVKILLCSQWTQCETLHRANVRWLPCTDCLGTEEGSSPCLMQGFIRILGKETGLWMKMVIFAFLIEWMA